MKRPEDQPTYHKIFNHLAFDFVAISSFYSIVSFLEAQLLPGVLEIAMAVCVNNILFFFFVQ